MSKKMNVSGWTWAWSALFFGALLPGQPTYGQAQIERPRIADVSSDHGLVQPFQQITFTVHLKVRNQAAFDKAVGELYTPGSATYHQWMSNSEIARYAPSAN